MIGWLLDTNVVAELFNPNGAKRVQAWAVSEPDRRMHISVLVFGEYRKGVHNLPDGHEGRNRIGAMMDVLEQRFAGRILPVSNQIVFEWGRISGESKRLTGQSPPVVDTLLAATSIVHDLYLVTRNVRDVQQSGAAIFNPWTDDAPQVKNRASRRT